MSDLAIQPTTPAASPTTRAAKTVTELFAPWVLILALFLALGAQTGPTGLAWGLLAATFPSIGPMAIIVRGVLTGRYTDHHLTTHEQRLIPLLLSGVLVIIGIAVLYLLCALLALTYGPALSLLYPLVALIDWSRVHLTHHTVAQVLTGAPTGALAAALPFLLIR